MKLKQLLVKCFRGYIEETRVNIGDLTALIGVNDVGKSTLLEALEIFFNSRQIKLDHSDLCVASQLKEVVIGCVFEDFDKDIIIDTSARTRLAAEHLLNGDGDFEIHKVWDLSKAGVKEEVFAYALHPHAEGAKDLLKLKINELKQRAKDLGVQPATFDANVKHSIRNAIRRTVGQLDLRLTRVPLWDEDAKRIWDAVRPSLPLYALFRADRPSTDTDAEVQDPMKVAVEAALKSVRNHLDDIKQEVQEKATDVAKRTIDKLKEMDPNLARELIPHFDEPKWGNLFRLKLTSDNQIPINKRGSGARRLILISFFRAEAERLLEEKQSQSDAEPNIIYAIEEPETSQHPNNQREIIDALNSLSSAPNTQVLLTTHVPGLASLLPVDTIRYLSRVQNGTVIKEGDDILEEVAHTLGVLPDVTAAQDAAVILFVEGQRDIEFLTNISATLNRIDASFPSIGADSRIVTCPVGGANLKDWVFNNYMKELRKPEVHIYDRDKETPPKYQCAVDHVNNRKDTSIAFLTKMLEMENYIYPDVIEEEFGFRIEISDTTDVPTLLADHIHKADANAQPWEDIGEEKKKKKIQGVKRRLNQNAARKMTYEQIMAADKYNEIQKWLVEVRNKLPQ